MKAEQSRTFATSIREEIVLVLKSFLKGQMQDAKKMMGDGYRLDYEMKLLFEKLEQVDYFENNRNSVGEKKSCPSERRYGRSK